MKKTLLTALATGSFALWMVGSVSANTIINNATSGYYNQAIGTSLNLTNPTAGTWLFPGDYLTY